jgi:hypothetical protein
LALALAVAEIAALEDQEENLRMGMGHREESLEEDTNLAVLHMAFLDNRALGEDHHDPIGLAEVGRIAEDKESAEETAEDLEGLVVVVVDLDEHQEPGLEPVAQDASHSNNSNVLAYSRHQR